MLLVCVCVYVYVRVLILVGKQSVGGNRQTVSQSVSQFSGAG